MKKYTFIILFLALFISPFTSKAMTVGDVQQQLDLYKSQSPSVLGASAGAGTSSADVNAKVTLPPEAPKVLMQALKYADPKGSSMIIKNTLKVGSNGDEAKKLQLFLNATGSLDLPTTGKFGTMTKAEVVKFQAKKGLKADGVVGPMTRKAISEEIDATVK